MDAAQFEPAQPESLHELSAQPHEHAANATTAIASPAIKARVRNTGVRRRRQFNLQETRSRFCMFIQLPLLGSVAGIAGRPGEVLPREVRLGSLTDRPPTTVETQTFRDGRAIEQTLPA